LSKEYIIRADPLIPACRHGACAENIARLICSISLVSHSALSAQVSLVLQWNASWHFTNLFVMRKVI